MSDAFESRARALEDKFFHQKDKQLLDQFRENLKSAEAKEALKASSGISDDALLDTLIHMDIRAETLASLTLLPLVSVAWADGKMEAGEQKAILEAANSRNLSQGTAGYTMVENWLKEKPPHEIYLVWQEYVGALKDSMDASDFAKLKSEIMSQAKHVAEAAGGLLGLVSSISPVEKAKLAELEEAFDE